MKLNQFMQNQIRMELKWLSGYLLLGCSQINGLAIGQIIRNPPDAMGSSSYISIRSKPLIPVPRLVVDIDDQPRSSTLSFSLKQEVAG